MPLANQTIPAAAYQAMNVRSSGKPRAPRGTGKHSQRKAASRLEEKFLSHWTLLNGPPLEREYMAVPGRKWRFDFAAVSAKILIEVHGGIWTAGRHVSGSGFTKDRNKMNAAQKAGWRIAELTAADIKADIIEELIADVRKATP